MGLLLAWSGLACTDHLRSPGGTRPPLAESGFGRGIIHACFDQVCGPIMGCDTACAPAAGRQLVAAKFRSA